MNAKQIFNENYEIAATKTSGRKVLNVYRALTMQELPKSLVDDYADPEVLCPRLPFRVVKMSTGNPDYGEWDAQVVLVHHGFVTDLYVCSILVRPFSKEAQAKYESMMGLGPKRRAALLWDSRVFDALNAEKEKPAVKAKKKRVRPTVAQMRALEEKIGLLDEIINTHCKEKADLKEHLDDVVACNEKYSREIGRLEAENRDLTEKNHTLEKSNTLMEQELDRQRAVTKRLSEENDELSIEVEYLNSRGFWKRVFNL